MTAEVSPGTSRARPQSGGFRTFLSWLKRDDKLNERSSSVESINSSGSDRTVTSFAFFAPTHYQSRHREPVTVPPPGPPTDSYRKRIQDRNLRLHLDRDLTLCRKYHLTADLSHYEGFSLPNSRHDREDRARRATSVCLQRRAPYVPGKRHAPAPPARASSLGPMTTQSIKRVRKRQAPPPPNVNGRLIKESIEPKENRTLNLAASSNSETNNKIYKKSGKGENNMGDNFRRNSSERSFLKQIFEGKKKISVFDPVAVRLLPSISELDRQAAEIIQMKLRNEKTKDVNNDTTNIDKIHSHFKISDPPIKNSFHKDVISLPAAEKEDLKKILKEMKDSLPKRPKPTEDFHIKSNSDAVMPSTSNSSREKLKTSISALENNSKWHWSPLIPDANPVTKVSLKNYESAKNNDDIKSEVQKTVLQIVEPETVVPSAAFNSIIDKQSDSKQTIPLAPNKTIASIKVVLKKASSNDVTNVVKNNINETSNSEKSDTNLNVVTFGKNRIINNPGLLNLPNTDEREEKIQLAKIEKKKDLSQISSPTQSYNLFTDENSTTKDNREIQDMKTAHKETLLPTSSQTTVNINKTSMNTEKTNFKLDQMHKDLISELEICILRGDENGAAKAATQLAQLRVNNLGLLSLFNTEFSADTRINKTKNKESHVNTPDICHVIHKQTPNTEASPSSRNIKPSITSGTSPPRKRSNYIPDIIPSTSTEIKKDITGVDVNNKLKSDVPSTSTGIKKEKIGVDVNNKLKSGVKLNSIKKEEEAIVGSSSKPLLEKINVNASTSNDKIISRQNLVRIEVWVEDRIAARGPVGLCVSRDWDLARLRRQAEITLGIPMRLQRWIVGNNLCSDDKTQLETLAGTDFKAPFYLCLVESELNKKSSQEDLKEETEKGELKSQSVYKELMELEQKALVMNVEEFECGVCLEPCAAGLGAVLRDCLHSFCRECLADAVRHCQEPVVCCPSGGCASQLQEREVRALVPPEEFERWLARGLATAESGSRGAFHCRTPDCAAWALVGPGARTFPCGRCGVTSCVACQAVHEGSTCDEYRSIQAQKIAKLALEGKVDDDGTRALLDTLIERGEALPCPECNAVITKKWGCDWVRCSACKTEICWITRGRRWGPLGRGDTSSGCRCGVDGKRCHPACAYCH